MVRASVYEYCTSHYRLSCAKQFTASTGKRVTVREEGHWSHTCSPEMFASSEHAWEPMTSSSVNLCRKTRTVPVLARFHCCVPSVFGRNLQCQLVREVDSRE
jgi:hypothetical protein